MDEYVVEVWFGNQIAEYFHMQRWPTPNEEAALDSYFFEKFGTSISPTQKEQ